jgi:dihydroorotate dehydrogenase electron transfer subunit
MNIEKSMAMLIEKIQVARDHYLLRIQSDLRAYPGQFINLRVGTTFDPLLRRPFSVHDCTDGMLEIIVRVVGRGTAWLRDNAMPGDINILPPMGNGFQVITRGRALLVGGGVGNAPLYYLAKELKKHKVAVEYILGTQSAQHVFLEEKYRAVADMFYLVTDDGSCGEKGLATDIARMRHAEIFDAVYTCGPAPMMAALVELFRNSTSRIEVSVENYFGCGIGLCSGCVVETNAGNRRACIDGPVFDGRTVLWKKEDLLAAGCIE